MNLRLLFIFVCVLISLVLFGCKQDGIKFYRESGVQKFVNEAKSSLNLNSNENSTTTRSSSGIIIYKDNSVKDTTGGSASFGPKDIDFSLPIK